MFANHAALSIRSACLSRQPSAGYILSWAITLLAVLSSFSATYAASAAIKMASAVYMMSSRRARILSYAYAAGVSVPRHTRRARCSRARAREQRRHIFVLLMLLPFAKTGCYAPEGPTAVKPQPGAKHIIISGHTLLARPQLHTPPRCCLPVLCRAPSAAIRFMVAVITEQRAPARLVTVFRFGFILPSQIIRRRAIRRVR